MPHTGFNEVLIAFGSNKGDCKQNIQRAVEMLADLGEVEKISPIFITKPEGFALQPDFLNGALLLRTALEPQALLAALKNIETSLGRRPAFRNAPREIDLDIIFYNDLVLNGEILTIPHPLAHGREFVLLPLSYNAPNMAHPVTGKTVNQMLKELLRQQYPRA